MLGFIHDGAASWTSDRRGLIPSALAEASGGAITKCHCKLSAAACGCKHTAPNTADPLFRGSESFGRLPGETLGVAGGAGDRDSPRD